MKVYSRGGFKRQSGRSGIRQDPIGPSTVFPDGGRVPLWVLPADAVQRLDAAPRPQGMQPTATRHYLYAHAHSLCGHEEEALACLQKCLAEAPLMAEEAWLNRSLAPLMERLERRPDAPTTPYS